MTAWIIKKATCGKVHRCCWQKTHRIQVQQQECIVTEVQQFKQTQWEGNPLTLTSCNSKAAVEWWVINADSVCLKEWNAAWLAYFQMGRLLGRMVCPCPYPDAKHCPCQMGDLSLLDPLAKWAKMAAKATWGANIQSDSCSPIEKLGCSQLPPPLALLLRMSTTCTEENRPQLPTLHIAS